MTCSRRQRPGFRLGIFIFKDAEIVDFAAPYGVFSVARRFDPALDVFFVAESLRPVQAQAGLHRPAQRLLRRSPGHGRLPDPGRIRHPAGDVQRAPA